MGRVFFLLCVLGLGWWCSTNGILYNLMHGFEPEPARKCVLQGVHKEGVYFAPGKEDISYLLDTHIGSGGQRIEAMQKLLAAVSHGLVYKVPESTVAKVVSNSTHKMYGVPHHIVEIEVVDGDFAGQRGWVEREDVVESPLMEAFTAMRASGRKKGDSD